MAAFNWDQNDVQFLANMALPVRNLKSILTKSKGARIGQSTVISQKVHTFNPLTPQIINILQDVDAGQAFYQRSDTDRVYHLDIFHERALVDHNIVAASLKKAVDSYNFQFSLNNIVFAETGSDGINADFIDIQTGTGGGRVTGSLNYGKKLSIRRAHENHVHMTVMMPSRHLAFVFYAVLAVENAILALGFELRCNERIVNVKGKEKENEKPDLSAYADQNDSFMQQKSSDTEMSQAVKQHKILKDSLELTNDFDTIEEVQEFLDKVNSGTSKNQLLQNLEQNGNSQHTLERLVGMGIVDIEKKTIKLTNYGIELQKYLLRNTVEIEAHLRKALRVIKPIGIQTGKSKIMNQTFHWRTGCETEQVAERNHCKGELDIAETVCAAAKRMILENSQLFRIECNDFRYLLKEKAAKSEICLIIDSSASMAGQRIRAAKFLVRHLLLTSPDRIGVVLFQENRARVLVPLTRDYSEVELGLREIKPLGATPLALGIKTCLEYLNNTKTYNPLIILITDGIPTMADSSRDPVADALFAAKDIKNYGYGFTCIGLKPHHNYLTQLAECAGGSAYILEELEKEIMVKAVWDQCIKRQQN
ncbi:vWA domain-containing protein [Dendrosporobacter sp. 1207_IL3150]|uniref:vWA domain-containing protein n=1 Tax=Dendrosporobacter sp. 1207_IL3150 TaxID=3084054 RepID=UPI002FD95BDC